MPSDFYASIVLGPPPSCRKPIILTQLEALAKTRMDMEVRVGNTGTKSKRDMIVVHPTGEVDGVLSLIDGRLQTRKPNEKTLAWMLELAEALGGRVVDNTQRTYKTPRIKYIHPDDVASRQAHFRRVRAAKSKWIPSSTTIAKWSIICLFIAAGFIALKVLG